MLFLLHLTFSKYYQYKQLLKELNQVFHQIYKANMTDEQMFAKILDTLTVLATGGARYE